MIDGTRSIMLKVDDDLCRGCRKCVITSYSIHYTKLYELDVELWGVLPAVWLILVVPLATTAMFLIQELVPILRHRSGPEDPDSRPVPAIEGSPVVLAAAALAPRPPDIFVIRDDDPEIHSVTSRSPGIYVTTGLLRSLEPAELKVAIAHEIAHT